MRISAIIYGLVALSSSSYVISSALPASQSLRRDTSNQTGLMEEADEPHNYTFDELKPQAFDLGSYRQPYFRFLILFKKKPGVTDEYMHRHWKTIHADLTMSTKDVGIQIQRYVQFHQDQEHKDKIKPLVDTGFVQIAPYDGIAEFHAKDYKSFQTFLTGVFNNSVIIDDQNKFVDQSVPLQVMAGYDNLIFGSGIKTSGGYDGILPGDPRLNDSY